jgi:hypothetical protein
MSDWNFDEMESSEGTFFKPEAGKRYTLVVSQAKDDVSKVKKTPYLGLSFKTEDGMDAYGKEIYNTPKALFRAQEWFKALGMSSSGKIKLDPASLVGIRITAECAFVTVKSEDGTPEGKAHNYVRWEKPERVAVGQRKMPAPMEDVPF